MAINPKLEFFRFKLNHKDEEIKTFKDFAVEGLNNKPPLTDNQTMKILLQHFIESLDKDISKDGSLLKQVTLVNDKNNKHLEHKPKILFNDNIISGVINGGAYGRERIIADIYNKEESRSLEKNKSVLQYYYFLLYLPLDHNVGFFMINSNSKEESVTVMFRRYISRLFKGNNYNKVNVEHFCPISFQKEFKEGAVLDKLSFKHTYIDNIHSNNPISEFISNYDIKIEAIPKDPNLPASKMNNLRRWLQTNFFGNKENSVKLNNFEKSSVTLKNPVNNSKRTFEWSKKDNTFIPVVYLNGRLKKTNSDGTFDFEDLEKFCYEIFKDEIMPEIRPDLYVTKS